MEIKTIEFGSPEYQESISLRDKILRKPLGLVFFKEDLQKEFDSIHLGCYNEEKLLACLVLKPLNQEVIKMRQVAVDDSLQGQGVGTFLVQSCEYLCDQMGFEKIVLHARENAIRFYLKQDYSIVGQPFKEVGLPHFKMEKVLSK